MSKTRFLKGLTDLVLPPTLPVPTARAGTGRVCTPPQIPEQRLLNSPGGSAVTCPNVVSPTRCLSNRLLQPHESGVLHHGPPAPQRSFQPKETPPHLRQFTLTPQHRKNACNKKNDFVWRTGVLYYLRTLPAQELAEQRRNGSPRSAGPPEVPQGGEPHPLPFCFSRARSPTLAPPSRTIHGVQSGKGAQLLLLGQQ